MRRLALRYVREMATSHEELNLEKQIPEAFSLSGAENDLAVGELTVGSCRRLAHRNRGTVVRGPAEAPRRGLQLNEDAMRISRIALLALLAGFVAGRAYGQTGQNNGPRAQR